MALAPMVMGWVPVRRARSATMAVEWMVQGGLAAGIIVVGGARLVIAAGFVVMVGAWLVEVDVTASIW